MILVNVPVGDLEKSARNSTHETDPGAECHSTGPWGNNELINKMAFSSDTYNSY